MLSGHHFIIAPHLIHLSVVKIARVCVRARALCMCLDERVSFGLAFWALFRHSFCARCVYHTVCSLYLLFLIYFYTFFLIESSTKRVVSIPIPKMCAKHLFVSDFFVRLYTEQELCSLSVRNTLIQTFVLH